MITGATIQAKRIRNRIAGHILCRKLGDYSRGRLSDVENEVLAALPEELARIDGALDELIKAKSAIQQTAAALGWPVTPNRFEGKARRSKPKTYQQRQQQLGGIL
jgi:hypothetical protein